MKKMWVDFLISINAAIPNLSKSGVPAGELVL